ncbi:type IV pilus secretin PilQ [Rhodocyclus tenuis]|uniref:Type IV pilus assembly protein PilQ n=1 Tax=Rhodocyclus tenuis TaxID=1066 RepID=A0A840G0H6_RHOTE|nr:type IV pilus secretin PilQ [Rhodocyclus tenuis]MBB4245973.1 type IV pilus assembly protein PilQ [Rhodocyclus tenuis]
MKRLQHFLLALASACLFANAQAQDSAASAAPGNAIESMNVAQQGGVLNVKLAFRKPLSAVPASFSVARPPRIAFDFPDTANGLGRSLQNFNEGDLRSANILQVDGRTRLVLNLGRMMSYTATLEDGGLLLALTPSAKPDTETQTVTHFAEARPSKVSNSIRDINFRRGAEGEARITVDLSDPSASIDIRQQGPNLVVDFVRLSLPETLRKRTDVTDFATPVLAYSVLQQGSNARMTIQPKGLWEYNAYQSDNQFVIEVKPIIENPNKLVQGTRGGYQGEKLSLNFQNVDVRRLLQVIGEFTGLNMVVSDSVGGSITLILKDVPWDQALDIILQQKGLDMRKNGNVVLIAPREEIATKEKLEFESRLQIGDLEPLRNEAFQLNYQKADAVQKLLTEANQRLLSKRGSAVVDTRTNILFVQDTPSRLDDVRQLIAKVDLPVRQVLIEARIVEASDTFSKNIGVRLGYNDMNGGGRNTGVSVGGSLSATGYYTGQIATKPDFSSTYGVNLPATPRSGTAGAFSFILFNAAKTAFLNTEISALEADGRGKVISSPRVMTANQVEALIEQGVEIPYQQATSSGATSVSFRKANLSLKVKPQITPDGKITMSLDVKKDTPNTKITTGSGVAIDTKHVSTEVLVENGGTVVIGGIYTQETKDTTNRIPFLGDLPYIGFFFRNNEKIDDKSELLIFITPRIVTETLNVR